MKKSLMIVALLTAGAAYAETRWCQPDEEKPKQSFDYFIAGDGQTCYVQLSADAKNTLQRMLDSADKEDTLGDVIDRVSPRIVSEAGQEALDALEEMAENDPELPAGVVKDGIFGGAQMLKKARAERQ